MLQTVDLRTKNEDFVDLLVKHLSDFNLLVSDHPTKFGAGEENTILKRFSHLPNVHFVTPDQHARFPSWRLAQHVDGLSVTDSKTVFLRCFFSKPVFQISSVATGAWLNTYTNPVSFAKDLRSGTAKVAHREDDLHNFYNYSKHLLYPVQDAPLLAGHSGWLRRQRPFIDNGMGIPELEAMLQI
ncbi:hypothetical protein [Ruegeria sp. HKCCD4318-2]|uniref:hypothetical protein n=1 Tax=Ruegeria sp. HKCCD4318-2 TaxID=2683020 RepID=UPI001491FCBD|nr:hypothetical protein [Ruegeria sp. HKCCD4318-2]